MTENTKPWWYRFLPNRDEPKQNGAPPVAETPERFGIAALIPSGDRLNIVDIDSDKRGVRFVQLPESLVRRYWKAQQEDADIQRVLKSLPYTHRKRKSAPRKPKAPVVSGVAGEEGE